MYYLIDYVEYIIIWLPMISTIIIFLLVSFILLHVILIGLCESLFLYLINKSNLNKETKFAIILQKQYKKKKLIKKLEQILPLIEEIYYTPNMKGYYICEQRFIKLQNN